MSRYTWRDVAAFFLGDKVDHLTPAEVRALALRGALFDEERLVELRSRYDSARMQHDDKEAAAQLDLVAGEALHWIEDLLMQRARR